MIKYYVFDSMRNLMPIWAYLKKSYTYVVAVGGLPCGFG